MKAVQFSHPAAEELAEAVRWYEMRRPGLGGDFYDAVVRTIERIQEYPEMGTERRGQFPHRRLRVSRFPYRIVYRIRENDVYIVAVAHTSRRPGYWRERR